MARGWGVAIIVCLVGGAQPTGAQQLNATALQQIMETAKTLCGEFARDGFRNSSALEGSARAELAGLAGRLVDLGVEGAGKIDSTDYANVLQEQLGEELQNQRECNLQIWNDLRTLVTTPAPQGNVNGEPPIASVITRSAPIRAGFDCAKASTPTERLICSDHSLARTDLYLNDAYSSLLDEAKSIGVDRNVRLAQKDWIAYRDSICPVSQQTLFVEDWRAEAIACLIRETERRASVLASGRY